MEKLKEFLKSIPEAKILDVGTGVGNFISLIDYLYRDYEKMVGIDIVEGAIKAAEKHFENNPKIKFVVQDINTCEFPEEHFDVVCLSNSLHHLDERSKTFRNMERLVKPGGYLLFNEMMKDNLNDKQVSHLLLHHFAAKIDRLLDKVHFDTYDRLEIVDVIKSETQFKVINFWDMEAPKQETSKEEIEAFANTVDRVLAQLPEEKRTDAILNEAESIKEYILKHGVEGCTQLIVLAKK